MRELSLSVTHAYDFIAFGEPCLLLGVTIKERHVLLSKMVVMHNQVEVNISLEAFVNFALAELVLLWGRQFLLQVRHRLQEVFD